MTSVASRCITVRYLSFSHLSRWVLFKSIRNFSNPSRPMHNPTFYCSSWARSSQNLWSFEHRFAI